MINILEDRNIAFHGVNYDYFKMMSILQYGILSEKAANIYGLNLNRNFGGYNGNDKVSLAESPEIHGTYNHGAFYSYICNGISFIIDIYGLRCTPCIDSGIPGEVCAEYEVPKERIVGIMIPESEVDTTIDQLKILNDGMGLGYVDNYVLNFVDMVNEFFETSFDKNEILELIEEKKNISEDLYSLKREKIDSINEKINTIITKMFDYGFRKKYHYAISPTLVEAIEVLTKGDMPIYTTNGNLLTEELLIEDMNSVL